ncbi:hypothetical protein ZWY2020_053470 [Hordeum vulgare]|nr:hypothetical protein ZWY2020_053470 [Hordeum vulgare]
MNEMPRYVQVLDALVAEGRTSPAAVGARRLPPNSRSKARPRRRVSRRCRLWAPPESHSWLAVRHSRECDRAPGRLHLDLAQRLPRRRDKAGRPAALQVVTQPYGASSGATMHLVAGK